MNARTGGEIMASGSTNRSTGTGSTGRSRSTGSTTRSTSQTRTRTSSQATRKKQSAVNDQAMDDIIMIVSAALCIFLFLCRY